MHDSLNLMEAEKKNVNSILYYHFLSRFKLFFEIAQKLEGKIFFFYSIKILNIPERYPPHNRVGEIQGIQLHVMTLPKNLFC